MDRIGPREDRVRIRDRLKAKIRACISFAKVRLSSGKETDFYFDGRQVSLDPEGSALIGELMMDEIERRGGVDAVGGLTSGADPITSAIGVLAYQRGVPLKLFYVRKEPKSHGLGKQIEGPPLPAGATVVIVDDVITTGKSILESRRVVENETGARVLAALVVVDREEGGRETLEREGLEVVALFRRSDFLP